MNNIISSLFSAKRLLRGFPAEGELPADHALLSRAVKTAWPAAVESFFSAISGFIDTAMVGTISTAAISAVGLTTQPKFIGLAIFFSLNVAVSAIVSRRKGEGNRDAANRTLRMALFATGILTLIVTALFLIFAPQIITLAGAKSDTHADATLYLRIIMGGMVFNVFSMVINAAQRGVGNTKIAMRTNLVSNAVNVCLNWLLIGGNLGFPALGIKGAAIATVCGTVVACIMSICSILDPHGFLSLRCRIPGTGFDRDSARGLLKVGSSTLVEQLFMRFGFMMYALIIANLGTNEFAAHQIGMNVISISFSFADGLSAAAVTLVGQSLGERRRDLAKIFGSICQRIGVICSSVLAVIFVLLGRHIFRIFSSETVILDYGEQIMRIVAVVVFLQIAQVICSGCLRGAGDTKFTAIVSFVSIAVIRPLSCWLLCYPLGLGLIGAWVSLLFDQICRFTLTSIRFRSGKWMNIRL